MNKEIKKFPKHACQFCGCERKLVETIIDDEFFWDKDEQTYQPNKFTDVFEHTGNNRCAQCEKKMVRYVNIFLVVVIGLRTNLIGEETGRPKWPAILFCAIQGRKITCLTA